MKKKEKNLQKISIELCLNNGTIWGRLNGIWGIIEGRSKERADEYIKKFGYPITVSPNGNQREYGKFSINPQDFIRT